MKVGIWIALAFVVLIIVYIMSNSKKKTAEANAVIAAQAAVLQANCVPFTQKDHDDALRNLRSKCGASLLIPVLGVGAYSKCMAKGQAEIPEVKNC